jgi:hypothetical protein
MIEILGHRLGGEGCVQSHRPHLAGRAITAGTMIIISYILWVAPRTLGRQHANRLPGQPARLVAITTVLGPFPRLLIMIGNAVTLAKIRRRPVRHRGRAA